MPPDMPAFDPFSERFAQDPYAVYSEMRDAGGLHYYAESDIWMLPRYRDIAQLATNPSLMRVLTGYESEADARARQRKSNLRHNKLDDFA